MRFTILSSNAFRETTPLITYFYMMTNLIKFSINISINNKLFFILVLNIRLLPSFAKLIIMNVQFYKNLLLCRLV